MTPGPKFSSSTSAVCRSLRKTSAPRACLRLSVRLRLLALNDRKKRLSASGRSLTACRAMSPLSGSSTLMTSAPSHARIWPHEGPAWLFVRSTTRMPVSAWRIPLTSDDGDGLDLDERVRDREVGDLDECARGRIGAEELRAHLAVRLAVTDVGDEHRDLHDVVHRAAARHHDLLDVLEHAPRLRLDVADTDELAVLVVWELTRDVDRVTGAPAERVARALVLHVGRSDRDACHQ